MFVIVISLKKVHLEYAEQTLIFHKKIEAFQRLLSESTIYNLNKIVFFFIIKYLGELDSGEHIKVRTCLMTQ